MSHQNRIFFMPAFFLYIILIFFTLSVEAKESKTITVAMSLTPLSTPFIIADEKGYFSELGLNLKIKNYKGGFLTIQAVFDGEADLATSSEAVVMFNSFKRSDFGILASFVSSDNDVKIITKKNSGIKTPIELAGRRIGTVKGASSQFFLDQTLILNGVSNSEVTIIHFKPQDLQNALIRDEVDAISIWEPYAYLALTQLGNNGIALDHDHIYIETFNAVVKKDYAKNNPKIMSKILRGLIKATKYINKHKNEVQKIVAKRLNKDINLLQSTWNDFNFEISLHQKLITTLNSEAYWAIKNKLVTSKTIPNYVDFILDKPLRLELNNSVTIKN